MKQKNLILRDELTTVLWGLRREFVVVGVFSMVVNLLMLTPTLYMLQVYDRVVVSQSYLTLLVVSLICLFLYGVMAFSEWVRSILLVRTGVKLDQLLSHRVFKGTFLAYLNPSDTAPAKAFNDLTAMRQFLTGNGVFAFFDSPWVPIYLGVLFMLHPWLGMLAIFFALVQAAIAWLGHSLSKEAQLISSRAQTETQGFLSSKLRNVDVLVSMGMLNGLYNRWREKQLKTLLIAGDAQTKTGGVTALSKFVRYAQQSLSLGAGALLVVRGEISPGAMIAANVLMSRALAPIDLLVSTWPNFLTTKDAFERLRTLLQLSPPGRTDVMKGRPVGRLVLDKVTVRLPEREKPVLDGVSFEALPGTVTVVLGPSGSGKSTLARAMMGIGQVPEGKVLLDGRAITDWTRESLGPYVGYLPQDIELFDGTVAENIARIGEVNSEAVIAAAEAAGLHQMILRFPKGYDTPMGQAGAFLSGGQRQRIGLARALYGEPSLVVLDEPNANLDDEGEKALLNAMLLLKSKGANVILISHRPGVLAVADRVVILQEGQLVAAGPRNAVLQALKEQREAAALTATPAPSAGVSA